MSPDKVGRKAPIVWGYVATLVLLFPLYWGIGALANPHLARQARELPVVVAGPDCRFDAFAADQASPCAKLLSDLTATGVSYRLESARCSRSMPGQRACRSMPILGGQEGAWQGAGRAAGQGRL
jgi:hypothetical protein